MTPLRVVSFGLGPIGLAAAQLALTRKSIELVGALDVDPQKAGKDLAELFGSGKPTGIRVENDWKALCARTKPDAILHCTSSFLPNIKDQLVEVLRSGVDIVSSAEELLVPDLQHAHLAELVDAAAREGGASCVGTGVNPGFAMDYVAIVASAVTTGVERVRCVRVVDAGTRRLPLQKKVGAGLSAADFEKELATGRFGHIGIRESVALLSRALGLGVDAKGISHTVEPVLATEQRKTKFLTVEKSQVAGIRNVGFGKRGTKTVIELDLSMYVGAPNPRDEVYLFGSPNVKLAFDGGIPGDQATAAILVNTLHGCVAASPGLKTILDLAPPRLAL
jgi:4-hydroxy-tetrahydrodipicolinate reductase